MKREVYLDNSATTRPRDEVIEEMVVCLRDEYGNPSSSHTMGLRVEKMIKKARGYVANNLKCSEQELFFTSGGTEANNIAIRGCALASKRQGNHIITTKFEHDSVLNTYKALENEGYKVTYLDVSSDGYVDINHLTNSLTDETILVSIMFVNSEIGTIQPISDISNIIKRSNNNIKFHVDAVQAYAKIITDPAKLGVDLMTISSHKIHGPKGVGGLYVKSGTNINRLIFGGGQEGSLRPGTENVPGIIGFGKAAQIESNNYKNEVKNIEQLRDYLQREILSNIPDTILNGSNANRAPHILNISFLGIRGEVLLHALANEGIYVATGSACSTKKNIYSHVLNAMGLDNIRKEGAIRFSLGAFNTKEDIDYCLEKLVPAVKQLSKFKRR